MSDIDNSVRCPNCESPRIQHQVHHRLGTDWDSGHYAGLVNQQAFYLPEDKEARNDVDVYICLACDFVWSRWHGFGIKQRELQAERASTNAPAEDVLVNTCGWLRVTDRSGYVTLETSCFFTRAVEDVDTSDFTYCPYCGRKIKIVEA